MSRLKSFKLVTAFGKRLYVIKQEQNLTCQQIADQCGVTLAAVARWLSSYSFPQAQAIVSICKAYNVSADWVLGLSDERR